MQLASIEWQLLQQRTLETSYQKSRREITKAIAESEADAQELRKLIPMSIRFLEKAERSRLMSNAMQQLLDTQLELATVQAAVKAMESKLAEGPGATGKLGELRRQELQLEIEHHLQSYKHAAKDYETYVALRKGGSPVLEQEREALMARDLAKFEAEAARMRLKIEQERSQAEAAEILSKERLAKAPLEARKLVVEEFLKNFEKSAEVIAKLESVQQRRAFWQKDLELVAAKLFEITFRIERLESLRSAIAKRTAANADKDDE